MPCWIREGARLQALLAQPEAALFPDQGLQPSAITTQEDETVAGIGILAQLDLHHAGQRVDTPTHVLWAPRNEHATYTAES